MALPESDQRGFVCAARECRPSQLSSDAARVLGGRKDPCGIVRKSFTHHGTREHRTENGSQQGPPVPRLSLCDATANVNKSRQIRSQTQAHMGSS